MFYRYSSISLTLVLALCLSFDLDFAKAAPINEYEAREDTKSNSTSDLNTDSRLDDNNLTVSQPPKTEKVEDSHLRDLYYPYRQSMSPRLGLILDPSLIRDSGEFPFLFGISYMLPRTRSPQIEFSFDILTDSRGHFSAMLRRIFNERQSFRPYIKAGATLSANADEKLATASKLENYLLRASVGMEDVIELPMSVRIEFELALGTEEQIAIMNFGYSWGW